MFKFSHTTLIVLSGLVWLAVGSFLLPLGLNFVVESILRENLATQSHPVLDLLGFLVGGPDQAALVTIALALVIGYTKGHYILSKTVYKGVNRITEMPDPAHIKDIYTKKYYILLASMMFLGFIFRFASFDVRGFVDITIGSALIHGAILYFRLAYRTYQKTRKTVKIEKS